MKTMGCSGSNKENRRSFMAGESPLEKSKDLLAQLLCRDPPRKPSVHTRIFMYHPYHPISAYNPYTVSRKIVFSKINQTGKLT